MKWFLLVLMLPNFLFANYIATIVDFETSEPIKGAIVSDSLTSVKSDDTGTFKLKSDEKTLHVKAYGYRPISINISNKETKIFLRPINVKALYLSFWGASNNSKTLKRILDIIDKSDVNAIIMDVKNEFGMTSFRTGFEQANSYGASKRRTNKDIYKFIEMMKDRDIYTIARIVTFKDELQAKNHPEYAIRDENGDIWRNHDKIAWVDPFSPQAHDYTISIAEEAAKVGFDEINFDYARFPARQGLSFLKENTTQNRIEAIESFLSKAKIRLKKYGVFTSVDIYGNILLTNGDSNIGQTIESFKKYVDYIAPMLYPSGFQEGTFGLKHPSEHPYEVFYMSLSNIKDKIDMKRIRPWTQHFKDYAHTKRYYEKDEIQAQIRATKELNTNGWMGWSPSSRYKLEYIKN